jgi:hypothetical protein
MLFCKQSQQSSKQFPLLTLQLQQFLSLATDASSSHVGAVLQPAENKAWKPLAFFSKKLSPTQQRYSTFDRELLAIFLAIKHFRFLLEGRQFHVITDHNPLTAALHRVSSPISVRQQRQLAFIAEFTGDIRYIPGSSNVVADSLCRPAAVNNITASMPAPTLPSQQQSLPGVVPAPNLPSPAWFWCGSSFNLCSTYSISKRTSRAQHLLSADGKRSEGLCSGAAPSEIFKSLNFFSSCWKISSGRGHVFRDISSIGICQMAEEDFSGHAQHITSR